MSASRKTLPWIARRRRLLLLVLALITAVFAPIIFLRGKNTNALETRLAELKAKGVPLTYSDLRAARTAPKKASAPEEEKIVLPSLWNDPAMRSVLSDSYFRLPNGVEARASELLAPYAEVLAAIHQKIRRPDGSVDTEALRSISQWLQRGYADDEVPFLIEALAAAKKGDWNYAYEALLLASALSDRLSRVSGVLEKLLSGGSFTDQQLAALAGLFPQLEMKRPPDLIVQRVLDLDTLSSPEAYIQSCGKLIFDDYVPGTTKFLLNAGELVGYSNEQKRRYLDGLDIIEQANALPRHEGISNMRAFAEKELNVLVPSTSNRLLRRQIAEFRRQVLCEAQQSAVTASLGIERFYRREGRFPDRLQELTPEYLPELPLDPCIGQPLQYRRQSNGYTLYSVGLDQDDDHGVHEEGFRSLWRDGDYLLIEYP